MSTNLEDLNNTPDAPPVVTGDRLAEVVKNAERKRTRKAKQEAFDEMKQEEIPEVSAAAERYVELRDERMELTKREVEARESLIELMHKHSLTTYKVEQMTATLETSEKVKVQIEKEDEPEVY